jgi:hypothetical protein
MALADNIRALWRFNGDATDATGNGHNGSVTGATFNAVDQLLGSGCASFDHIDDYIDVGNLGGKPTTFALNIWIKPNFWGTACPFTSANLTAQDKTIWGFLLRTSSQDIEAWTSDGINSNYPDVIVASNWNPANFPSTAWAMITMVVSGTTTDYYKDGVYVNSVTVPHAQGGTAFKAFFGKLGESSLFHYGGLIDESALWDRVLTNGGVSTGQTAGGEIAQLWNGGSGIEIDISVPGGVGPLTNGGLINKGLIGGRLCG